MEEILWDSRFLRNPRLENKKGRGGRKVEKERKRLLVRAHPPLFKALERVRRAKDVFRGKRDGKRGRDSFGRDTVYMQMLNTRAVSTANFSYLDE